MPETVLALHPEDYQGCVSGSTTLVVLHLAEALMCPRCESAITQSISGSGGTVQGYKKVSVKQKGNTATVVVNVSSDIYNGNAKCDFNKSNWTIAGVGPA